MAVKSPCYCPKCGATLILVAQTEAYFEVDEDGLMGKVILDKDGIDYINDAVETANPNDDDIEFKCRTCHSSFAAKPTDHEFTFEVGEEL